MFPREDLSRLSADKLPHLDLAERTLGNPLLLEIPPRFQRKNAAEVPSLAESASDEEARGEAGVNLSRARCSPLVNRGQRFSRILPRFTGACVIKELPSRKSNDPRKIRGKPPPRRGGMPRVWGFYFSSSPKQVRNRDEWHEPMAEGGHCRKEGDGGSLADVISNLLTGPVYEWIWARGWSDQDGGDGEIDPRNRHSIALRSPGAD